MAKKFTCFSSVLLFVFCVTVVTFSVPSAPIAQGYPDPQEMEIAMPVVSADWTQIGYPIVAASETQAVVFVPSPSLLSVDVIPGLEGIALGVDVLGVNVVANMYPAEVRPHLKVPTVV